MTIEFDERDFRKGYWYYRPKDSFPPKPLPDPDRYSGEAKLHIGVAASASTGDARKLKARWTAALPSLTDVRVLWISGKVSQVMFDAICRMQRLEALWLKWSGIKSLEAMSELGQLQSLHIGSSTQIDSIQPLPRLEHLRWLELENIKKIRDISPIARCTNLLGLAVQGSMWSTQRVETLEPVGQLLDLRYLNIANLRSADKTLKPLLQLHDLRRFISATWWDAAEIQELYYRNPKMEP